MRLFYLSLIISLICCNGISAGEYNSILRDSILRQIEGAKIPETTVSILKFGAKGDGLKDCKPAFDKAMKKASRSPLHIIVPKGEYFVKGPIHLVSNVCLELQEGATLKFSPDAADYLPAVKTSWEGTLLQNYSPFIYAYNVSNVSIIGKGTIDGNCADTFGKWRARQKESQMLSRKMNHDSTPVGERNFGKNYWLRPQLIQFYGCSNITLEDFFITNSPFWCIHLLKSDNIICRRLRYDAKLVNNDGIDPEFSRNILIEDISFNNGDDNIAIKAGRDNDGWTAACPSENIIIRKCHFKGLHAVVIGSEMSAGVRNVFIEDCDYGGYCKRGIYIKTNPDRGGFVKNIWARNLKFGEVQDLFFVTNMYAGEGKDNNHYSRISDIHLSNISCKKATGFGLVLQGSHENPIRNVSLTNIDIEETASALSFDYTENVSLNNCHLGGYAGEPTQVTKADNIFR